MTKTAAWTIKDTNYLRKQMEEGKIEYEMTHAATFATLPLLCNKVSLDIFRKEFNKLKIEMGIPLKNASKKGWLIVILPFSSSLFFVFICFSHR
jgi:hypothetical protein